MIVSAHADGTNLNVRYWVHAALDYATPDEAYFGGLTTTIPTAA